MSAIRRDYAAGSTRSADVVRFDDKSRVRCSYPSRSGDTDLKQAVEIVTATADILDELMKQNDAFEAETSKTVAKLENEAAAAQHESEGLRSELHTLRQMNARHRTEAEARIGRLEETLEKKSEALARRDEELEIAKQWIEHFRSRLTELLFNVAKELELRPNIADSAVQQAD